MTEQNKDLTAAQMLQEARTSGRRKREIATISRQLCIREEYLLALENGEYHVIPEVVYILGFARNYAMELGLDPDEIVTKIKQELGVEQDGSAVLPIKGEDVDEADIIPSVAKAGKKEKNNSHFFESITKFIYKQWKWLLAGLIALVIIVAGIVFLSSLGNKSETVVISNDDGVVETTVTVNEPEYSREIREKFGTENAETASIIVQAIGESWIKIEDGRGNTVFSRVLVPGDVYYLPQGDKYKATFGNAGGVDIWVDGKLAPKLGAANTRKSNIAMTAENLMSGAGQ